MNPDRWPENQKYIPLVPLSVLRNFHKKLPVINVAIRLTTRTQLHNRQSDKGTLVLRLPTTRDVSGSGTQLILTENGRWYTSTKIKWWYKHKNQMMVQARKLIYTFLKTFQAI